MKNLDVEFWQVLSASILRYAILAGGAYLAFYVIWKRSYLRYKIQRAFPRAHIIQREVIFSALTLIIFSIVIFTLLFTELRQWTLLYSDWDRFPAFYNWVSFFVVIFFHDTYFYWIHRFMHLPQVFKRVHHIHHESRNPTPLASFSFHPLEAVLEVAFLPLLLFTMPVHRLVLLIFGLYMVLMNVWGHLGYELLPKGFLHSSWKWLNTSTGHNLHHRYSKYHFGLYFSWWDKWMGTNHPQYESCFEQAASGHHAPMKEEPISRTSSESVVHGEKPAVY